MKWNLSIQLIYRFLVRIFHFFLGNISILYVIHSVILPTEQSMLYRTKFRTVLKSSMIVVTIFNIIFGILAASLFGKNVAQNVVDNLKPGPLKTGVLIALSIDLLFTCALFILPLSEVLDQVLFDSSKFGKFRVEFCRKMFCSSSTPLFCSDYRPYRCFWQQRPRLYSTPSYLCQTSI